MSTNTTASLKLEEQDVKFAIVCRGAPPTASIRLITSSCAKVEHLLGTGVPVYNWASSGRLS
jgi:hypothetical protein